jgi:hypothetical protein
MNSAGGEIGTRHHDWSPFVHVFSGTAEAHNHSSLLLTGTEPHIAMILALAQRTLILPVLYLLVCSSL